ncbi:acetate/propionate family kinase [Geobacter pelophilus]|uniref:Acetate kinase n=1 Tax=Geoanaerobacter pelophilus TaxID=60036 RepID=A0AAW4LH80_9BACT|nr:acetate/propionate family kinase [Geoanaerobacter pelophilus]MBT0666506.1 acetate/propionate family kinase [Geoanaerobacter pelophilus]
MKILTLNCLSHSIKYHLFTWEGKSVLASGTVDRVGLGGSCLCQKIPGLAPYLVEIDNADHQGAIAALIAALTDPQHGIIADVGEISAVGHRVAHGGKEFRHSVQIDSHVLSVIRKQQHLAPLHCTPNIAGIEAAMVQLPNILHVAVFDTAFHSTMPEHAYLYPLPYEWHENYGVRRYGFHGPSHYYLSRRAAVLLNKSADSCNLITIHLDRGVSLCAIRNGLSIDTSMGMTPLGGAVMETRCGDIDPGIPAFIMQEMDLSPQEMEQVLNHKSGIYGITGQRLERQLFLQAVLAGDNRCKLALEMETYRIRKYIGAYLAVIGPLDGLVFSAGTGASEWLTREMTLHGLECFGIQFDRELNRTVQLEQGDVELTGEGSLLRTFVIPTSEERVIVDDVVAVADTYRNHLRYDF